MRSWVCGLCVVIVTASSAAAQSRSQSGATQESEPAASTLTTTTYRGDTGLWFLPSARVLPAKTWSASFYRVNFDYNQGFTDVADFPATFGIGVGGVAEVFAAWSLVNRIDRDVRPLFVDPPGDAGGVVNPHPGVTEGWSGNNLGDLVVGGKVNLLARRPLSPVDFAVRGMLKFPTADSSVGAGTGATDFEVDAIVSRALPSGAELTGYGGFLWRGNPDDFTLTDGFVWGFGAGLPLGSNVRFSTELFSESYFDEFVSASVAPFPAESRQISPVNFANTITFHSPSGFFAGAGLNWNLNMPSRSDFAPEYEAGFGDRLGVLFRIGYHPSARRAQVARVAPAAPPTPAVPVAPPAAAVAPPAAPAAPPVAANRAPSVTAACTPLTAPIGSTVTLAADGRDADNQQLTYAWAAPRGTFNSASAAQTQWTAVGPAGTVPVTVTVRDPQGATATATCSLTVTEARREFAFEDVHFEFDRQTLRPDALKILDAAVQTMQQNPTVRLVVEGHTCNIGTAEYNLALGERRANAVYQYLISRGIAANRLRTVSYGEERPKHDNAQEVTRRLNRRAALVVAME